MILKCSTILGNSLAENKAPNMPYSPAIVFKGNGAGGKTSFGMTYDQLSMHTLLMGATGSGKTNTILHMLSQLKKNLTQDDIMLVFDSKLDFSEFHTKDDYVISNRENLSAESVEWNIFMDIVADGWSMEAISFNADEIAEVIFKEHIESSSQPFFPAAARDIFAAVIKAMAFIGATDMDYRIKYLNNKALATYLRGLDATKLRDFVGRIPRLKGVLKYVGNGKSDQALGVFAELESITSRLFIKCFGKDGRFSVRKAERNRGGRCLFIEYDPSCGMVLQPIYRILVDMFLKEALSPERNRGRVFIVCDELKMLPLLNHFEDALNFGRSLGISVIAGIQSMEQLYEVYDEYGGKNIASGFQSVFCFRTNNAESREYIKGIHGSNVTSIEYLNCADEPTEEMRQGNSVEDWDITGLKKGEAVIGLVGEKPFKFYMERYR